MKQFIQEHAGDDLNKLLLSSSRYPTMDIPFAVDQIAARRQLRDKLPSWYANDNLIYPSKIAAEQCSSELTARYKQQLIKEGEGVCDLTGGLGVDSSFFSQKANRLIYIERFENYCEAARHNFQSLAIKNIEVIKGDATEVVETLEGIDVFYIDPARRGEGNKRVFALSDCEPDLSRLLPVLFQRAPKVIAKLSPMVDIQHTLHLLPETTEVHVLSVKNECKELLFVMERGNCLSPLIYCQNILSEEEEQSFQFTYQEEQGEQARMAGQIQEYLYEPNASILKAGAFKCLSSRLMIEKLGISSHLYTSTRCIPDFPGRVFSVEAVYPFTGKLCKTLSKEIPKANITVRNFPLSVAELRARTKITDGGELYLFATTLAGGEKVLIKGRKVIVFANVGLSKET